MIYDFLKDKSILVTGGTGSFGQRFIKTLLEKTEAKRIVVFSRDELKQSQIFTSFEDPERRLRFFIGDVRDSERLERAFNGVDLVVHAAALKQVPALEYNPFEAVKTNILGTQNVVNAALNKGVEKVVLLSTDKAANPANLYGATKLCAEKLIINGNSYVGSPRKTMLSAVRYGNVFGSRGSLVKILESQKLTGKVTLTHENMTRFWITLDHGVELVLMALEKMRGGEIFIPKIPSMKVKDLIEKLAPGCEIVVTGIRPGEKMHETLITSEESRHTMEFENHYIIYPEHDWWDKKSHPGGRCLPEDLHFSSVNNDKWLDDESLKTFLI